VPRTRTRTTTTTRSTHEHTGYVEAAALDGVGLRVLEEHVRHGVRSGGDEKIDELRAAVDRLVRSR
jgi:hypothetical protein